MRLMYVLLNMRAVTVPTSMPLKSQNIPKRCFCSEGLQFLDRRLLVADHMRGRESHDKGVQMMIFEKRVQEAAGGRVGGVF